jgi:uncharacterized damage-inducible protein DinB
VGLEETLLNSKEEDMPEITPWFTRSFPFPVSAELIPNIASRLRGTPARLEELLRKIDPDLMKTRLESSWSIQEHVGHLGDIEPLWLSRIEDYIIGSSELTPTDLQNKQTDAANHNAQPLDTTIRTFRDARAALLRRVESLGLASLTSSIPHPRLRTPMRIADHLYFVAEHDDHHLATIHSLLAIQKLNSKGPRGNYGEGSECQL